MNTLLRTKKSGTSLRCIQLALGVLLLYACAGVGFLQLRSGGMLWLFTAATGGICVALLWILCKRNAAFARPFETFFSRLHWITILLIALTLRLIWVFGADATEHSGHPLKYEELAQYIYHGGGCSILPSCVHRDPRCSTPDATRCSGRTDGLPRLGWPSSER